MPRSEMTIDRAWDRSCEFAVGNIRNDRNSRYRMKPESYQFRMLFASVAMALLGLGAACNSAREATIDPALNAEIQKIRAIDHHAHPPRITAKGEPPDRGFDALPVDNMEPASDPVGFRPGNPAVSEAARALYGGQTKQQT